MLILLRQVNQVGFLKHEQLTCVSSWDISGLLLAANLMSSVLFTFSQESKCLSTFWVNPVAKRTLNSYEDWKSAPIVS